MIKPLRALAPIVAIMLSAFAFTAVLVLEPPTASAQTATNLKCRKCVGKSDIGKNAIRSGHIKNGKVKAKDLNKDAKPAEVVVSEKVDLIGEAVTTTPAVYRTATIETPGPGAVIATYFGSAYDPSATLRLACGASTASTVGPTDMLVVTELGSPPEAQSLTGVKVFEVMDSGPLAVNFVCFTTAGTAKLANPHLSLLFVPGAQSVVTESSAAESASTSTPAAGILAE